MLLALLPWARHDDPKARAVIVIGGWFLLVRYEFWRFDYLPQAELTVWCVFSYFLFGAELISTIMHMRSNRILLRTLDRRPEADQHSNWYGRETPLIDVFIPTYNENNHILEKTIVGVRALDYSRFRVWVLDDGDRAEVRALASDLGVNYLSRSDRSHFKAGNLNHGLQHVMALDERPDYICVFDADFIPKHRLLKRLLALMWDPQVAVVQSPQHFYNPDPLQVAFGGANVWPDDQRAQFDVRMAAQDAADRAACCGTSFLVRTTHLMTIGGFPTESISEDTLMSMKLACSGKKTVYLNEPLSVGLAAEGLQEYMKQRARWCSGTIQNMKSEWGPRRKGGIVGWLLLAEGCVKWGLPLGVRTLFLTIPAIYWFTGFSVINGGPNDIAYFVLPMLLHRIGTSWLHQGRQLPIVTDAATVLSSFVIVPATIAAVLSGKPGTFKVTAKGLSRERIVVHWGILSWLLLLAAMLIVGMAYGANAGVPDSNALWHYYWSYYALLTIAACAIPCIELPRPRNEERYAADERATLLAGDGSMTVTLRDLSVSGAALSRVELAPGEQLELELEGVGRIAAIVVRRIGEQGGAVRFAATREQRHALIRKIYCSDRYIRHSEEFRAVNCLRALLQRAFA